MRGFLRGCASALWVITKAAVLVVGVWLFLSDIVIPLMLCDQHPDSCGEILERVEENKRERWQ